MQHFCCTYDVSKINLILKYKADGGSNRFVNNKWIKSDQKKIFILYVKRKKNFIFARDTMNACKQCLSLKIQSEKERK